MLLCLHAEGDYEILKKLSTKKDDLYALILPEIQKQCVMLTQFLCYLYQVKYFFPSVKFGVVNVAGIC